MPVQVSGVVGVQQGTAGTDPWAVTGTITTGGLTDAQLRATPVPVSGTVSTGGLTDTQLRASAVPVSGTVTANLGTTGTLVTDSNLDEKFGDLGQRVMTGSAPVVIASDQTAVPVSGTVTANLGTTGSIVTDANLDEKFGDLGQAVMASSAPVVIASNQSAVPVSGTVTANIGTSGSLALDASVTGLQVAQASTTSGQSGGLMQAACVTSAPSLTTAKTYPLSLDTSGNLRVLTSGTSTVSGTVAVSNAFALDASVTGLQVAQASTTSGQSGSLIQAAVTTSAPSYTTAKTSPLSLTTGGALRVDASAASVTVTGTVTANQGGSNWSVNAAQVGGGTLALGQTTASASIPVVCPSNMPLATSGGCSISRTLSANNTTGIVVKNAAGQLYGLIATNTNAAARFVKLYNIASAPTVGTTVPVMTLVIPGNSVGAGLVLALECGVAFGTGIGLGITTAVADNDTGAPAANEVVVNVLYA